MRERYVEYVFSSPALVAIGLVLLAGRYDWTDPALSGPQWRGYLFSAFFFSLTLPVVSALLDRLVRSVSWRRSILGLSTFALCAPYRWLGLQHWYYYSTHQVSEGWGNRPLPHVTWFPAALWAPSQIPGESLFFAITAAILVAIWWMPYVARRGSAVTGATFPTQELFGTAVILLVVGQTWMHLSMRSPYTYISHFVRPAADHFWYHVYLFPKGMGAVNADYFVFRALEDAFLGTPGPLNAMLIRRPFPFYISSQLSYFFNTYYVMLALNICAWILAVWALLDFASAHFGKPVGIAAALLAASAPGFIMYVAQPQTYLWGYAGVMLVIWAHWRLCMAPDAPARAYVLFGGVLALALLTYDLFSIFIYLVGYQLIARRPLHKLLLSIGLALAVYAAFGAIADHGAGLVRDDSNSKYLAVSLSNAASVIRSTPISWKSYDLYSGLLSNFVLNLGNTVFVFPLLLAVIGLCWFAEPKQLHLIGLLMLPSAVNFAVLYFGQTELAGYPRFVFIAYPAVYICCGILVAKLAALCRQRGRVLTAAVWIIAIVGHLVLTNADVFGHPWMYYMFYFQRPAPTFDSVESSRLLMAIAYGETNS